MASGLVCPAGREDGRAARDEWKMRGKDETILAAKTPSPSPKYHGRKGLPAICQERFVRIMFMTHCARRPLGALGHWIASHSKDVAARFLQLSTPRWREHLRSTYLPIYHPRVLARPVCSDAGWFRWCFSSFQKCFTRGLQCLCVSKQAGAVGDDLDMTAEVSDLVRACHRGRKICSRVAEMFR